MWLCGHWTHLVQRAMRRRDELEALRVETAVEAFPGEQRVNA